MCNTFHLNALPFIAVRKENVFVFEKLMKSRDRVAGLREHLPYTARVQFDALGYSGQRMLQGRTIALVQ